jgi:hypothetical protein
MRLASLVNGSVLIGGWVRTNEFVSRYKLQSESESCEIQPMTSVSDKVRQIALAREKVVAQAEFDKISAKMMGAMTRRWQITGHITDALHTLFVENGFSVEKQTIPHPGRCECNYAESCGNHDELYTIITC